MISHLALRMSSSLRCGARHIAVVQEHNAVFERHGLVAVGKIGVRVYRPKLRILKAQIAAGIPTRLFLVESRSYGYAAYSAEIAELGYVDEHPDRMMLFPPYYRELGLTPGTYFVLSSALKSANLESLTLTGGQSLVETIKKCRTTHMLVRHAYDFCVTE